MTVDMQPPTCPGDAAPARPTHSSQFTVLLYVRHGNIHPSGLTMNEVEPAVANLRDLLHFQPHSIVSRVLLKNKGGNVTLFAFDQGEGLSEHTAPFDALVIIVEGEAEVEISGTSYRLREAETIVMPADQPHAIRATTQFKMLLTMVREP